MDEVGATQAAVGTRVWVRAKNGLAMEVVYITLDRPRSVGDPLGLDAEGNKVAAHLRGLLSRDGVGAGPCHG